MACIICGELMENYNLYHGSLTLFFHFLDSPPHVNVEVVDIALLTLGMVRLIEQHLDMFYGPVEL